MVQAAQLLARAHLNVQDDVRFWLYDVEDGSLKIERFSQLLYLRSWLPPGVRSQTFCNSRD